MRVFVVFILSLCLTASAAAQKVYYIYLESDNSAAFYVKMSDKIYSSSASGSLTISNLVDSTYKFSLGFPSGAPESKFIVPLKGKDHGFVIKHLEDGIALFDLQSLSLIKPETDQVTGKVTYQVRTDAFSTLLSKAASDSSLLLVPVQVKQEETAKAHSPKESKEEKSAPAETTVAESRPKHDESLPVVASADSANSKPLQAPPQPDVAVASPKTDSVAVAKEDSNTALKQETKQDAKPAEQTAEVKTPPATIAAANTDSTTAAPVLEEYKRSVVTRHSESSTSEGFGLVFYDTNNNGSVDTIRLVIPNQKHIFKQDDTPLVAQTATPSTSQTQNPVTEEKKEVKKEDNKEVADTKAATTEAKTDTKEVKPESKKDTAEMQKPAEEKKDPVQQQSAPAQKSTTIIPAKSNCRSIASDKDFFKLRKNMAAISDDDDMVNEAKKYFKNKCYTTDQIRNLSTLFLTSAGKYQFFDAAFTHVADQENFPLLQAEIKDDYYLKRFKALIGE